MVRVSKQPDVRRGELIDCAQRLFYTKGYDKTSVNDIVSDLGVAKGTYYYYFDSKQSVLEALVAQLVGATIELLEEIVADSTLEAIPKLIRIFNAIGHWKDGQHDQVMPVLAALYRQENFLLLRRFRDESIAMAVPTIASVIQQGIDEGVFDTEYATESAEIFLQTTTSFSDSFAQVLLHRSNYDDPSATVKRKKAATESAIERLLGAPQGSLPIFDPSIIKKWLTE